MLSLRTDEYILSLRKYVENLTKQGLCFQLTNLEEPWGRCNASKKLDYAENYTLGGCALECKLTRVIDKCECKPYYFPGEFEICSYDMLVDCAYGEIGN